MSPKTYPDGRNEINMGSSSQYTKWKMKLFSRFIPKNSPYLKAGDVVKISHKEFEGFLMVDDTRDKSCLICPKTDIKKNSTNTLWEIETEDVSCGGIITYNRHCRIKHVASGLYLTVKSSQQAANTHFLTIGEFLGPNSLFSFRSTKKEEGSILSDAFLRLYNPKTNTWVHGIAIEGESSTLTNSTTTHKVETTQEYNEEDVFTLVVVNPKKVDDLEFILGLVPTLNEFIQKVKTPS